MYKRRVTTGDAYLFDRLGGFSGGVSLDEPLLPASSLTRNTRKRISVRRKALVCASLWSFLEFMNVFPEKRNHKFESRPNFSCSVLGEQDESSRMAVSTWVCALSFGRCRMSKFWLLVYLDFFESLRPALASWLTFDAAFGAGWSTFTPGAARASCVARIDRRLAGEKQVCLRTTR